MKSDACAIVYIEVGLAHLLKMPRQSLDEGDIETARKATLEAISVLDKAAEKGVLHKNNAARRKGRLMKRLHALEQTK